MSIGVVVALGVVPSEPQVLAALSDDRVHVVRRCVDVADLLATAATRQAQVALVGMDLRGVDTEVMSRLIDEGVVVVGIVPESGAASEAVLRQMGAHFIGAADDLPGIVDVVVAAGGTAEPSSPAGFPDTVPSAGSGRDSGRVFAIWGSTGSPGRSVVATGLAAEFATLGQDTMLVDADVYGGSIAQMLGILDESSGLLAATRDANAGTLTADSLRRHCRQVGARLRVLTGLPRADRWVEAKSVLVRAVLATCREIADISVVDSGFSLELDEEISYDTAAPRRNGATIEILEHADAVVVVGCADPVGLSRLIRGLAELRTVVPSAEPVVVVNRVRAELGWSRDQIADTVRRASGVGDLRWLPDDPAACDRALVRGLTLREVAPGSKLTKALEQVAAGLSGPSEAPTRRRRAFRTRRGARAR